MITSFIKHKVKSELPGKITSNPASWLAGPKAYLLADLL